MTTSFFDMHQLISAVRHRVAVYRYHLAATHAIKQDTTIDVLSCVNTNFCRGPRDGDASMTAMYEEQYRTQGGIVVHRCTEELIPEGAVEPIIDALDARRGALFTSSYEYPGRYTRWDMGFVDPPLEIVSRQRDFRITALNARGTILLPMLAAALEGLDAIT